MKTGKLRDPESLARKGILELQPYASARDEYVSDGSRMVFLDANENPFGNGLNRYPDPQQRALKQLLAGSKNVDASSILLGNGSDEVLDLLFRAFCEPGLDNVITLPPTYGMYKVLAAINHVENREVQLLDNFQPDVNGILSRTDTHSKLLFLCSPNNPTANSFGKEAVAKLCDEFPGLVVIDEAYIDFSGEAGWLQELTARPNLVITQTLSKAYGMAGIRLGIGYASADIVRILNRIKPPYNVNELTQQQAMRAVEDAEGVRQRVTQLLKERNAMALQLLEIPYIEHIFPSDANFLLVRVDDAARRYAELLGRGIVVRNRSGQPLCENCLRITVGSPEENQQLISALKSM